MSTPEDFPVQEANRTYHYQFAGFAAQQALDLDRPDWLKECIEREYIDATTEMFGFLTIRKYAEERGRAKCAALLKRLNYSLTRQRAA